MSLVKTVLTAVHTQGGAIDRREFVRATKGSGSSNSAALAGDLIRRGLVRCRIEITEAGLRLLGQEQEERDGNPGTTL